MAVAAPCAPDKRPPCTPDKRPPAGASQHSSPAPAPAPVSLNDQLRPRATLERLLGDSSGGAAWTGEVGQAGVREGRSLKCLAQTRQLIYTDSFRFRTGGQVGRQRLSASQNDRQGHRLVVDRAPVDD
eukprot:6175929-Pleurochrysis_carterae.AAC.3